MPGLTPDGIDIKRFDGLKTDLNNNLEALAGVTIDTSALSVPGIINSITARELSLLWELAENVYDGSNLMRAEGEQLDNLGLSSGLTRNPSLRTRGLCWFAGRDGTTITPNVFISSLAGNRFTPINTFQITSNRCSRATIFVQSVENSTNYQVTIDNILFSYESDADATLEEIISGLKTQIDLGAGKYQATLIENGTKIQIRAVNRVSDVLNITFTTFLGAEDIETPSTVVSEDFGFIPGDANSIVNIVSPVNGWDSVNNYTDLTLGRFEETDEEFRLRIFREFSAIGSGTRDTTVQRVLAVTGVTAASVIQNTKWVEDTSRFIPLPPKTYMVIVHGVFDPQALGDVIWANKPLSIRTIGNTRIDIVDRYNQPQTVYYVQPLRKYVYMRVRYSLYTEETAPADRNQRIATALNIQGNTLAIGEDIIPKRFYKAVYDNVTGIGDLTIEVALDLDPAKAVDDPTLMYSEDPQSVDILDIATFAENRMDVQQN